jgi:GNAT superfamily N-acetyltransferase
MQLYEVAFPPAERVMISSLLCILRDKEMGEIDTHRILALTGIDGELMGIACDEYLPELQAGYLWYIAIQPGLRSHGVGTHFYRYMINTMLEKARLVIFEVEKPELGDTIEKCQLAERRIQFYRRNGARILGGIHYVQSVGDHIEPVPMHLMVHLKAELPAHAVFDTAKGIFRDALRKTGDLHLI